MGTAVGSVDFVVRVDPLSSRSVYGQIEDEIRYAISSGRLKPGDALPSIREIVKSTGLNPNTVVKALRTLQVRGVLDMKRGVGVVVAPSLDVDKLRDEVQGDAVAELGRAVRNAVAAGFRGRVVPEVKSILGLVRV